MPTPDLTDLRRSIEKALRRHRIDRLHGVALGVRAMLIASSATIGTLDTTNPPEAEVAAAYMDTISNLETLIAAIGQILT